MASKKEEKGRNIQVVVRCRPLSTVERKSVAHNVVECDHVRKEINVRTAGIGEKAPRKTYTYDMVFGPSAKQIDVYRSVVYPILDEVILGYNCTVFAYGQTGTGKTFTMEGERSPNEEFTWEEDPLAGIIPRTLHQIFEKLSTNGTEFSVKVSLLEIYKEELFDLLSPSPEVNEHLLMFDDPRNKRGVVIKGLEEITVHNKDEVYQILERGSAKRKTASTLMNAYSSRSHSVFSITILMKEITIDGEELVTIGKLNLVDLAGSENIGRSGAVEKRAREAGNINQSLLTLGRVITALVGRTPHIPYRESKLTRILQDSLGGRTRTSIIATVSPAHMNLEETLSTLEYASRARNIVNRPEVNQKLTKRTLIKEYTEEIKRLKRDLATARDKNGVDLSTESFEAMNSRIMSQEEQNTEFLDKISAIEEELKKVKELFSDSREELNQCSESLQATRRSLEEAQSDLELTKQRLSEETFLVSALKSTASQLLTTVDVSTKDATGLHEKLDRKKSVEQHNSDAQQRFADQMDAMFAKMQTAVEKQGAKQQGMLNSYKSSVAELQKVNDRSVSGMMSTVTASFKRIKDLVRSSMAKCHAGMMEQETLCGETNRTLQTLLEEHEQELQKLLAMLVPGLTALGEMNEELKQTLRRHYAVAEQMERMRSESASFFRDHRRALVQLRETATAALTSLQTEQESLTQRICEASHTRATRISQVISCMEGQMRLLDVETKSGFSGLLGLSDALQGPVASLKQTMQTECGAVDQAASAWQGRAEASSSGLVTELRQVGQRGQATLEESSGQVSSLQAHLSQLGQDTRQWGDTTRATVHSLSEWQLALIRDGQTSAKALQQDVEASCDGMSQEAEGLRQQALFEGYLMALQRQTTADHTELHGHTVALSSHIDTSLAAVHSFLKEELRRDVPTGGTPQHREYSYSKVLARTRSRSELLESFRLEQQQELQESLTACDTITEEPEEQGPAEDELSSVEERSITQQSDAEEALMCSENGIPFFKRKHRGNSAGQERRGAKGGRGQP